MLDWICRAAMTHRPAIWLLQGAIWLKYIRISKVNMGQSTKDSATGTSARRSQRTLLEDSQRGQWWGQGLRHQVLHGLLIASFSVTSLLSAAVPYTYRKVLEAIGSRVPRGLLVFILFTSHGPLFPEASILISAMLFLISVYSSLRKGMPFGE